jgi:periplasmic copper chaperone A
MIAIRLIPLAGMLALAACNAAPEAPAATEAATSQIAISDAWSRQTAQGQDAGGAFMMIANTGSAPDRLTGGTSEVAGEVQVHTMTMEGGVMRMRELADGLEIPAGGNAALAPGANHIMLMDLKRPLEMGEMVPLTLTFEKAGPVEVMLEVRSVTGPVGADHE